MVTLDMARCGYIAAFKINRIDGNNAFGHSIMR